MLFCRTKTNLSLRTFFFVIQQTVAVSLEILVGYLTAELLTHALIFLRALSAAGTEAARSAQPFLYGADNVLVLVQAYFRR